MKKIPMTKNGEIKLRAELDQLKHTERPRIIKAIAEAREHGDLKENAEYHAAREQQSFAEGRIIEIQNKLGVCQVIDITLIKPTGKVLFGTTVDIFNTGTEKSVSYQIVGDDEANVKEGKISVNSPIARALIGKQIDDVVDITTPGGQVEYEIENIQHL
ncbi:MAG: transcription elongation factor GreA [Pseudomonadales bacterium]|nr:transcription elongation factor GreA [Pseudomonadales bacterium]